VSQSDPERLTKAVLAIFRANGQLMDWSDAFAAPFGLTSARWQMLGALALAGGPASTPTIARAMGLTRQGARKQLALLFDEGLIRKRHNPAHKRSPLYELTDEGARTYDAIQTAWADQARSVCTEIPSESLDVTLSTLATLCKLHSRHQEDEGDEG
jgi:DNA-binding MarR family transcriptional regulator